MNSEAVKYMQAALKLAKRGIGLVEPNPAVGAVIIKANQIIGRGWHKKFGGPHAEISAMEDCKTLGISPQGAVMYVTLEPCSHQGKTAPCTEAIIKAGLAKVVVATIDPSEHASGRGIEQLRNAGIAVETGVCEEEAKLLNAPFIKFAATGRCWTILKWAQTIDGKMAWADKTGGRKWISNELSRKDVHKLRRRVGAILVGINTVIADDPLLTARPVRSLHRGSASSPEGLPSNGARPDRGKKLIRVVLDSNLRIPLDCKLLATAGKEPVLILTTEGAVQSELEKSDKITRKGPELLPVPAIYSGSNLNFLLEQLSKRGIAQLLVEGGPTVISSFLKENLADEIRVYISPRILGGSGSVDISEPMAELTVGISLHHVDIKRLGDDVCISGLTKGALSELGL